jgi:hypothetical protein
MFMRVKHVVVRSVYDDLIESMIVIVVIVIKNPVVDERILIRLIV